MPPRTFVYIDGFNFYGCIRRSPYRWLDLFRFSQAILPKNEIVKVKYFTAIVKPASTDQSKSVRQQTYLRALATIPNLATELLVDGFANAYDVAVIVTNDSDLTAPVRAVCRLGKAVGILNPHKRQSVDLRNARASSNRCGRELSSNRYFRCS